METKSDKGDLTGQEAMKCPSKNASVHIFICAYFTYLTLLHYTLFPLIRWKAGVPDLPCRKEEFWQGMSKTKLETDEAAGEVERTGADPV